MPAGLRVSPPRIAVVGYKANSEFSARGRRARQIISALSEDWEVDVVSGPPRRDAPPPASLMARTRSGLKAVHRQVFLDRHELWSRRHFARWDPDVDAALLIGAPFSPLIAAARRLSARGIPFV